MIPWTDLGRFRFNNASLLHTFMAQFEADRQLMSAMGLNNNKVHIGGSGRAPTVSTPWLSQLDATTFANESGSYSQPMYGHEGGDSWSSFTFSPEQMDYQQRSISVPESTSSAPPLLYDTVKLGPIIDCSGVGDLILDKFSTAQLFLKEKETTSTTRIFLPPSAPPVTGNVTAICSKLQLDTFGTLHDTSVPADSLLQLGKDKQVKKLNSSPGNVNWNVSDPRVQQGGNQVVELCGNKVVTARNEQRNYAAMQEEHGDLRNYRKGRHPKAVTLQKSDHMRRERDRRIAVKLMYKTLDSMIPKRSKKTKRDRTAIVDDALKYVKGLQEKLEKLRGKGVGGHKSSRHKLLDEENVHLITFSTSQLRTCSGDTGPEDKRSVPVFPQDQECTEADFSLVLAPKVDVFIGCGNEVLINITCRPKAKLLTYVLEALELFCLDVQQYSCSNILEELVHCNFRAKHIKESEETPPRQMIEEVLKSLLK